MLTTILELAALGVGGLAVPTSSALLLRRSKRRHQALALRRRDEAGEAYKELSADLEKTNSMVSQVLTALGPNGHAAFDNEARVALDAANEALQGYLNCTCPDPNTKLSRGQYRRVQEGYSRHRAALEAREGELSDLHQKCIQIIADIEAVPSKTADCRMQLGQAALLLADREHEGWPVKDLNDDLRLAEDALVEAENLVAGREYLLALKTLGQADQAAAEIIAKARELPMVRQELQRRAEEFRQQCTELTRRLEMAKAMISVLTASYAEPCWAGMNEEIDATRLRQQHADELIGALTVQLRIENNPQLNAWGTPRDTARRIESTLEAAIATCNRITAAPEKLRQKMKRVRQDVATLRQDLSRVVADVSDRTGNQDGIRAALVKLGHAIDALASRVSEPRPNPWLLQGEAAKLDAALDTIDDASARINDEEEDEVADLLLDVAAIATLAVGIDLAFDED